MDNFSVFSESSYKDSLIRMCALRNLPLSRLAESIRIQRQYLNTILRGKAHLTEEQIFDVAFFFKLSEDERSYLLLLLRENKTTRNDLKNYYKSQMQELKNRKQYLKLPSETTIVSKLEKNDLSEFYLDLDAQIVHGFLFIPAFQKSPSHIYQRLGISEVVFTKLVEKLKRLGLAKNENGKLIAVNPLIHLQNDSMASVQNHANWRTFAAAHGARDPFGFRYSLLTCANSKVKVEFIARFRELIADMHNNIKEAPEEAVMYVGIDVLSL